jgi:capsular polysaccharide biosynthesis protein
MQEYREIRTKNPQINPVKFIRLLLPFTAISVLGTVCIMFLHQTMDWSISTGLLVAIIISSITLPHSYVMELFYHQSRFHLR